MFEFFITIFSDYNTMVLFFVIYYICIYSLLKKCFINKKEND